MSTIKVTWTNTAKKQLKAIYDYYKIKSPQGAKNVKNDILKASKEIVFTKQYQKDEIEPDYWRIIVRHYKLVYTIEENSIYILRIFDTRRDPSKQVKDK